MTFYCLDVQGIRVIRPLGEKLDAHASARFKSEVIDSFVSGARKVLVDMSLVEELDVKGVAAMLSASRASGKQGVFALSCLSEPVRRYLDITKTARSFLIFPNSEIAVQELAPLGLD